ncbi:MAG: enoyl-CoA hydratase / 3-hydroxyacyl-CoA dehydrogenase [Thermodesulfobacteriota bacterium]|nr:enoyl-CoA hydratase / 3-hydroxyacyl-CoA dehydrogenase [Thermodesulfobacteriota bacterium]
MNIDDIRTLAVIGAGDMGHGIAEVALIAGYKVYLRDINHEFVNRGVTRIHQSLEKLVSKGKIPKEHHNKIYRELLVPCVDIGEAVGKADLVIEAIPEIMDLKKETFREMDKSAPARTLFASNTSTMKITEIASVTGRQGKVMGLHYFNPAVLMKLVEVIKGEQTSEETMQIGYDFVLKNDKVPVRVKKDVPGFIVNRVQAPAGVLLNCILDEKIAGPEEVDAVMRKLGMPMGPFETMDYTGLDIYVHGSNYFAKEVHPDFSSGKTIAAMVKAGNLGKKSGRGLFDWSKGRPNIELSKATEKFDPLDLLAVNANEATKIVAMGVCSLEDIDTAIINATGNPFGLIAMIKGIGPGELAKRLDRLADRFSKEIFRPTEMIISCGYK